MACDGHKGVAFVPDAPPDADQLSGVLAETAADIERAASAVSRLNGLSEQTPSGFNVNPWVLFRPLRMREARLSSKIENTVASSQEIALSAIESVERQEPREVQNYLVAVEDGARIKGQITETDIRGLHQKLLSGVSDPKRTHPGKYRPGEVYIGDRQLGFARARFVPPPAAEVRSLMEQFVSYMTSPPARLPRLIAAALCHYQFETIHPFADGNGRLGRMLITLSLCKYGLLDSPLVYPSAAIERAREQYYATLNAVSLRGDWAGWIRYFLGVIRESAEDTLGMTRKLMVLRDQMHERLRDRSASQRIIPAIDFLFEQPVLTPASLHERIGGSNQTARNYIRLFEERGIIQRLDDRVQNPRYFAAEILRISDEG